MRHPVRLLIALATFVATAYAQQPSTGGSDLDTLLALVGQPGVVNNQLLRSMNEARAQENAKYILGQFISLTAGAKSDLERLSRSTTREVAEAVRQLKPVYAMYDQAAATQQRNKEVIRRIDGEKIQTTAADRESAALFVSFELSSSELQYLKERGEISQQAIDAYRDVAVRNLAKTSAVFREECKLQAVADQTVARLCNQAELKTHNIVADVLVPAVRARTGAQRKSPLQVKWILDGGQGQGFSWYNVKINLRNLGAEDLTRLTLLFDFQVPQGSRYATFYIPKLPANGGGSFEPVKIPWLYLNPPKDAAKKMASAGEQGIRIRYSAWCDQYRAEGLEPTRFANREEMVNDTRLLTLLPGLAYTSQVGQVLHVNPLAANAPPRPKGLLAGMSYTAPFLAEYEPGGRYDMVFKKLTPAGKDYGVELELIDRANKSSVQLCRGLATVPAVKGDTSDKRLSLKFTAGDQEMEMELHGNGFDGPLWWTGRGEGGGRKFVPTQLPAPGSAEAAVKERLGAALGLAVNRKYDEAQAAYEKIAKDYPNTAWAGAAQQGISSLNAIKESHAKLDETVKAEEAAQNKSKPTTPVGRSPVARSNAPSPRAAAERAAEQPQKDRIRSNKENSKPAADDDEPVLRVTVDDVQYEYQGQTRSGSNVTVTVLATSKQGDHTAPHGKMTLVDADGEKYVGTLVATGGGRVQLREDVPVKLSWKFGPSGFKDKSSAPSAKITNFTLVTINTGLSSRGATIDFRNVPATVTKR